MRCGRGGWTLWKCAERAIDFVVRGDARFGGGRLIKTVFFLGWGSSPLCEIFVAVGREGRDEASS